MEADLVVLIEDPKTRPLVDLYETLLDVLLRLRESPPGELHVLSNDRTYRVLQVIFHDMVRGTARWENPRLRDFLQRGLMEVAWQLLDELLRTSGSQRSSCRTQFHAMVVSMILTQTELLRVCPKVLTKEQKTAFEALQDRFERKLEKNKILPLRHLERLTQNVRQILF